MMLKNINPFTIIFSELLQEERYSDKCLKISSNGRHSNFGKPRKCSWNKENKKYAET